MRVGNGIHKIPIMLQMKRLLNLFGIINLKKWISDNLHGSLLEKKNGMKEVGIEIA